MHRAHTTTPLRTHVIVLGIYTLLACIATWPLLLHLHTHLPTIPGEMGQDVWQNSWNVWWVYHALAIEHTNPYMTDMLFYPQGASLYLHSLILPLGIIGTPLTATLGIIPAYNILTVLVLVLAGYGSFLLARYIVQHTPAALVAGAIVMCSPQRLFELRGAQMATLNDYGVPLALLALLVALERRTWRMAALVAALLLLNGINKWYHLFHMLLIMAILLIWRSIAAWREGQRPALVRELMVWGRIAGISGLLLLPFLFPAMREALTTSYARKSDELVISADLLHVLPAGIGGIWQTVPAEWWYTHLFGWIPLVLALVGLVRAPRQMAVWATMAVVFFALSFGPHLRIGNNDTGIPMPYALFRWIPLLDIFRAPVRMNLLTTLMLGILAAAGLARILPDPGAYLNRKDRKDRAEDQTTFVRANSPKSSGIHRWRWMLTSVSWGVAIGVIVLVAGEAIRLPFPLVDGRVSPFYEQIANEPGHWSLLELPFDRPDREVLEMYQQTHHGKYILTGRPARSVPGLPYRVASPIAQADRADTRPDIVELSLTERDQLLHALRVRYLIIRDYPGDPLRTGEQLATARQTLGPLTEVYRDDELHAYRLDEVATWLDGAGATSLAEVPLFLGPDDRWGEREMSGYGVIRWLPAEGAGLWVYAQHSRRVVLQLSLYSIAGAGPLEIWLNGEHVQTVPIIGDVVLRHYNTGPLQLPAGRSLIELRTPLPGVTPQSRGLGDDVRTLTFGVHRARLVELTQ